MSHTYIVRTGDGEPFDVKVTEHDHAYEIEMNGETVWVDSRGGPDSPTRSLLIDGFSFETATLRMKNGWMARVSGDEFLVSVTDELWARAEAAAADTGGAEDVVSPMPGSVVKVLVEEGQVVEPGDAVVVVEAMKMQNELAAVRGGRVASVRVAAGDVVEQDAVLVSLEPVEES